MEMLTANFSREELACRCGCGLVRFHPGALEMLQIVRDDFGEGMIVRSACRCRQHNVAVGGHPRSLHVGDFPHHPTLGCLAFDIEADAAYRGRLFTIMWRRGFSIGWNDLLKFLHGDLRTMIGMPQTTFAY
jgi:hypothetical protein